MTNLISQYHKIHLELDKEVKYDILLYAENNLKEF